MEKSLGTITSKNGFYIGDPCYVLDDSIYYGIWDEKYNFKDGLIQVDDENSFIVHGTEYGDGSFPCINVTTEENLGHLAVDSGTIAVIPMSLVTKSFDNLGVRVRGTEADVSFEEDGPNEYNLLIYTANNYIVLMGDYEQSEYYDEDYNLEECKKPSKNLKEDFWNPDKYFKLLQDMEDTDIDEWNSTNDQKKRDEMVRPYLERFWNKYKEEMTTADIEALFDDMEDSNYHTPYRVLRDIIEKDAYKMESCDKEEITESTNHKMNSIKYNTTGYTEAKGGYYKGEPIVDYREKDFKKGTSVLTPMVCDACGKEFYIKSSIHDFFEQGDFDDPYETPKENLTCPKCKKDNYMSYNGEVLIKEPGSNKKSLGESFLYEYDNTLFVDIEDLIKYAQLYLTEKLGTDIKVDKRSDNQYTINLVGNDELYRKYSELQDSLK